MKLGLGVGSAVLSAVIFTYIFCCIRRSSYRSLFFWRKMNKIDTKVEDLIRQQGQYNPKRYSYSEIKKITNFFKDELGKGGYGSVYKGALPDGRVVAVKILNTTKGNGEEFINEVSSIGRTSHINVVTLLGFCYNGEKRALVYEYMSNGSLDKYIYNRDLYLGGEMLYDIALGVARGLEYLHRGCNTRILHFDIKPHNILLDQEFRPKIADFGLAKMSCGKDSIVSMAGTRGTIGYIAPEVFSRSFGKVSHKSDVYSYGMLLIEMVGGKNKYDEESENISDVHFPHSVYKRIEPEEEVGFEKMLLVEENELTKRMLVVGLWCIQTDPVDRPPMNKVIEMLGGSLEDLPIPPKPFLFSPPRSPPVFYSSNTNSTAKSDLFS
jgi:serine/threonine protein kinase